MSLHQSRVASNAPLNTSTERSQRLSRLARASGSWLALSLLLCGTGCASEDRRFDVSAQQDDAGSAEGVATPVADASPASDDLAAASDEATSRPARDAGFEDDELEADLVMDSMDAGSGNQSATTPTQVEPEAAQSQLRDSGLASIDTSLEPSPVDEVNRGDAGSSLTQCPRGTFANRAADPESPCIAWSDCVAGQFVAVVGSAANDRQCAACEPGTFSTFDNAGACVQWRTCPPGQAAVVAPTATRDIECQACAAGSYADGSDDLGCQTCPPGTFSGEGASECQAWTTCEPGSYVSQKPSSKLDRECSQCPTGTQALLANQTECLPPGACPAGTIEQQAATESEPAVCADCPPGTHCPGGTEPLEDCPVGTWDEDADPATACVDWNSCSAGQFVSESGSVSRDQSCAVCAPGSFSGEADSPSCSLCPAGTFSGAQASLCTPCPSGTDSEAGAAQCVCSPDCSGKVCGDDGCGGSCGSCEAGRLCADDQASCELDTASTFSLKTQALGAGYCLESNDKQNGTAHQGNSFMDECSNVTGQAWMFVPDGAWYRLQSVFGTDEHCLESCNPDSGCPAFMNDCQNVSGQLWKVVPDGSYFRLKSMFQGDDRCLDGNDPSGSNFGGSVFMADCASSASQRWSIEAR